MSPNCNGRHMLPDVKGHALFPPNAQKMHTNTVQTPSEAPSSLQLCFHPPLVLLLDPMQSACCCFQRRTNGPRFSVIVASSPCVHPAEYGLFPLHWCPFRSSEIMFSFSNLDGSCSPLGWKGSVFHSNPSGCFCISHPMVTQK